MPLSLGWWPSLSQPLPGVVAFPLSLGGGGLPSPFGVAVVPVSPFGGGGALHSLFGWFHNPPLLFFVCRAFFPLKHKDVLIVIDFREVQPFFFSEL